MKKLENFIKALNNLREVGNVAEPYSVIDTAGSVALFTLCFEQSWKAMKAVFSEHGYDESKTGSPRMIIKLAYSSGMIKDGEKWLEMLEARNTAAHVYNEQTARGIIESIKNDYICLFDELRRELEERWV